LQNEKWTEDDKGRVVLNIASDEIQKETNRVAADSRKKMPGELV